MTDLREALRKIEDMPITEISTYGHNRWQVAALTRKMAAEIVREAIAALLSSEGGHDRNSVVEDDWLIWSNEHRAWWAPDRCGYRVSPLEAGRYSLSAAMGICTIRSWEGNTPPETMIHVSSIRSLKSPPQVERRGEGGAILYPPRRNGDKP